jgi:hypothetical protein
VIFIFLSSGYYVNMIKFYRFYIRSDVDDDNNPLPCCRRNRRNDYEYTDSDTGTSDAESEDLERLL